MPATMLAAPAAPTGPTPIAPIPGEYRPGVCNIGAYEIRRRRRSAIVGFVVSVALLALLVALDVPWPFRLLVVLPLWGSVVTWLQARRRFCVGFAVARVSNFGEDDAGREAIEDEAAHGADMRAVRRMVLDGFLIAAPITLVAVALLQVVRPA